MITNQAYLFLLFIINGILIGILFDFFRILRKTFETKDFVTYIEDFLFWILTGIMLLYSIFTFNNGEIRLFMFLGVLLGTIIYMIFISSYVIKINVAIIIFIKNILNKVFKFMSIPFKFLYKLLRKVFFKPISFFIINIRKISTNLLKNTNVNIKNVKKHKKIENKRRIPLKNVE